MLTTWPWFRNNNTASKHNYVWDQGVQGTWREDSCFLTTINSMKIYVPARNIATVASSVAAAPKFRSSRGKRSLKLWNRQRVIFASFLLFLSGCPEKCLYLRSGYDRIKMRCRPISSGHSKCSGESSFYLCLSSHNWLKLWFKKLEKPQQ